MTQPAPSQPAPFQPSVFLEQIIRFLLPCFLATAVDLDAARQDILETLRSYGARTRAELLNAAQIIAFSLSALDTLSEARAGAMSPSMRLRYRGCANGLNRSSQQNEQSLQQRLCADPVGPDPAEPAHTPLLIEPTFAQHATVQHTPSHAAPSQAADPATAQPQIGQPGIDPLDTLPPGHAQQILMQAAGHRPDARSAAAAPLIPPAAAPATPLPLAAPAAQPDRNARLWAGAMIETLRQMGMPVAPISSTENAPA